MIHGARAALGKAAVALANKNARIVWAMLSTGTFYEPTPSEKAA